MKKNIYLFLVALFLAPGILSAQKVVEIKNITKAEFEAFYNPVADGEKAVYKGKKPAIVDFYADWCGPCKRLAPILEEINKEYGGKIVIYKVNVDKEKELAQQYAIRSIPTIFLFAKGAKPAAIQGLPTKEELKKYIEEHLKP